MSQGFTGNSSGSGTVTGITAGAGLSGGTITTSGTIALAPIASLGILANITGGSAVPIANTLTSIIDAAIGSTQGDVLFRGAANWSVLAPGTAGYFLKTNGAGADPSWAAASGGGGITTLAGNTGSATGATVTVSGGTTGLTFTGATATLTMSGTLVAANGGTGVTSVTVAPTASAFAGWDANANLSANSFIPGYATTATAAGTTTLTVNDKQQQYFTGSTTQTVTMPVTSTLVLGQQYYIVNLSSDVVTVQSSGANSIQAMAANTYAKLTCILTSGTTAASWSLQYGALTSGGSSPWSAGAGTGSAVGGDGTCTATGNYAASFGTGNTAPSTGSFCVGTGNVGSGVGSFTSGQGNTSNGNWNATFNLNNINSGSFSLVCGLGSQLDAGSANFIGGRGARNTGRDYCFMWGDNTGLTNYPTADGQFIVNSVGGTYLWYGNALSIAKFLSTGCSLIGTNTNDNADAGYVGEFITSSVLAASGVALTTSVAANITSISLNAGDYEVVGNGVTSFTGSLAKESYVWLSLTPASFPDNSKISGVSFSTGTLAIYGIDAPVLRVSLAAPATVYLSTYSTYAAGSASASGTISARRVR